MLAAEFSVRPVWFALAISFVETLSVIALADKLIVYAFACMFSSQVASIAGKVFAVYVFVIAKPLRAAVVISIPFGALVIAFGQTTGADADAV